MTPIERLKLVAELTALHNTAPEANGPTGSSNRSGFTKFVPF